MKKFKIDKIKLVSFILCLLMAIVCVAPILFSFFTSVKSEL